MTRSEKAKLAKLEAENKELREKLSQHIRAYGDMLAEIVNLKGKLEAVRVAMEESQ